MVPAIDYLRKTIASYPEFKRLLTFCYIADNLLIGVWLGKNTPVTQKNPTSGFPSTGPILSPKFMQHRTFLYSLNYSAAASVFSSAVVAAAPTVIVLEVTTGAASSFAAVSVDASSV